MVGFGSLIDAHGARSRLSVWRRVVRGFIAALVTLTGVLGAQSAQDGDWRLERKELAFDAAHLREFRLVNTHGDVRVRSGEGGQVLISAVVQHHADDPRAFDPVVVRRDGALSVEIRFDDNAKAALDPSWPPRRVDLGIYVPENLASSIRTGNGLIELEGLTADAELETVAGDIDFEGRGGLVARSQSGNVRAQFRRTGWAKPVSIASRTGNIRVELLEGARVSLTLETRAAISTDFSIEIERAHGSVFKRGRAEIGGGGQSMSLVTNRGGIRLIAVIVPEE